MQAMAQAKSATRRINIRTAAVDPLSVRCTVEDSGPGIKPEQKARLFESFFTTKQGGMGMGLPICRSIIEAHGERITADNNGIAGGACFSFASRQPPSRTKRRHRSTLLATRRGRHFLPA